jgi:exodeoxyribonuclease VII large subunit
MSEQPAEQKRTIRETNALVRALVEQEMLGYPFWIGGLVTKYFLSDFGHLYFDLNSDDHSINCMIREQIRGTLDFTIANGLEIEVFGTIRVYEKSARVQIEIEKVRLIEGVKAAIDTSLLQQLEKKGLWPRMKRPIPPDISKIGLVTSKQSDALHDFEDTYRSDGGKAATKVFDVRIQGQQAAREIAETIHRLSTNKECDVIVLVRGGGRAADLATFNDLAIAEAICQSNIPVLTGIGHQRDETLADMVADVSTITPTAAASYLAKLSPKQQVEQEPVITKPASRTTYYILIGLLIVLMLIIVALLISITYQPR